MKKTGKPVFFIVAIITIVFTVLSITGISSYYGDIQSVYIKGGDQIRWGIDIRGGVEVTFVPAQDGADPTNEELDGAAEVMRQRLVAQGINDYSVYSDYNSDRIVVQFPWAEDEETFDPETAIAELGSTAQLRFIEGTDTDSDGNPEEEFSEPCGFKLTGETVSGLDSEGVGVFIVSNTDKPEESRQVMETLMEMYG